MDIQEVINYVLTTPENTNPAILRGMLEQLSSGGGGGENGFTTAEVTIVDNIGEGVNMDLPIVYEEGELGEGSPAALSAVPYTLTSGVYKVALYKGKLVVDISIDVSLSGNIAVANDTIHIISGDCTITVGSNPGEIG